MIDEHEVREMLQRRADTVPAPPVDTTTVVRRARRRLVLNGAVATVAAAAIAVTAFAGIDAIRSAPIPADEPTPTGVFAPVAGRIVYENEAEVGDLGYDLGLWAIDPSGPSDTAAGPSVADDVASTLVRLDVEGATPLGWSSDGTELLFSRPDAASAESLFPMGDLFILHADGSETRLNRDPMMFGGATISPDGTRVVFAAWGDDLGLWVVDAEGGRPARLPFPRAEGIVADPTFSPDGTQIAYVDSGESENHLWVMDADGGNAHEILANEPSLVGGAGSPQWSPTGDRLAIEVNSSGVDGRPAIYTFAPDGSDLTKVIDGGISPYWSPDGSQIAYSIPCEEQPEVGCPEGSISRSEWDPQPGDNPAGLAIADADGSNVRPFGFAASGPWHPGAPVEQPVPTPTPTSVVPTDPGALAYWNDGDVFVADADGSNPVRIADGVPDDGSSDECADGEQYARYDAAGTVWSPDGRYLAYWDHGCPVPPDAWGTVLISDVKGNVIGSFPGQGWALSWSPDSTRVAVMDAWGQGDATIGVYGLDGTRQAALTVPSSLTPSGDYSPVWSRDGSSILLPGVQVPIDGDAPTPFPTRYYGVYSPDGSRVAYLEGSYRGSLVVADAVLPDAQKANDPGEIWYVAWSPNGDLVAFVPDETKLLVRDVATGADTSLVDVTRSEILSVIEFSPDGDRILFTRWDADTSRSSLWSIGADGSDLRRLVARVDGADLRPQGPPS